MLRTILIIVNTLLLLISISLYAYFKLKEAYFKYVAAALIVGFAIVDFIYLYFFKNWTY